MTKMEQMEKIEKMWAAEEAKAEREAEAKAEREAMYAKYEAQVAEVKAKAKAEYDKWYQILIDDGFTKEEADDSAWRYYYDIIYEAKDKGTIADDGYSLDDEEPPKTLFDLAAPAPAVAAPAPAREAAPGHEYWWNQFRDDDDDDDEEEPRSKIRDLKTGQMLSTNLADHAMPRAAAGCGESFLPPKKKDHKRRAKKRNQQKGIPGYTQVSSESTSSDEDVHCITGWQLEDFGFAENHRAFEHYKKKGYGNPQKLL